jgi:hypothetical protein
VRFINTDGMAFIGPGSEWFWTALSGIILAVTFIAIYRQLRAQSAANAANRMEALQGRWDSERMIHARLRIAIWRKHAADVPEHRDGGVWARVQDLTGRAALPTVAPLP